MKRNEKNSSKNANTADSAAAANADAENGSKAENSKTNNRTNGKTTAKKGRPTPKRKDAQTANFTPLVPPDRKAARKAAKAKARARQNAEYEAMESGDLNKMPESERIPERVYARDFVDARLNAGEFFLPVAGVVMISVMIMSHFVSENSIIPLATIAILYAYILAVIIDVCFMWRKLRKQLISRFGEESVSKRGRVRWYACSRALQIRRWRLPKPRYDKRGHYPEREK